MINNHFNFKTQVFALAMLTIFSIGCGDNESSDDQVEAPIEAENPDSKLIKIDGNRLYFDGFTFEKVSDSEINIYGLIHQDGKAEEVKFNYKKQ